MPLNGAKLPEENNEHKKAHIAWSSIIFFVAIAIILLLSIYYRTTLLQDMGFYEPDGFYHFSVIRAALANNFIVPKYLSISGWPRDTLVAEPIGLYWVTLFPYAILQYLGVNYYTVMRLIPILFGLLDMAGAYYLVKYLSKDRLLGILAFLLVGFSMGDAARTSALIYRGDGFVTIFLIVALILLLEVFKREGKAKVYFAIASGFFLSICNLVWNGGPFTTIIFLLIFLLSVTYYFLERNKEKLLDVGYVLIALAAWFIFVSTYVFSGLISPPTFTGITFVYIFIAIAIGWYISYYITKNREKLHLHHFNSIYYRAGLVVLFSLVSIIAIMIVEPTLITNIFVNNGFTVTNSFSATIQELQPPTPGFLYASFGTELYLTPMSIVLLISSYLPGLQVILWIVMALLLILYLFMHIERSDESVNASERILSERATIKFNMDFPMIALMAYFLVTSYLQINAVRFNSLISIPLAIFAAYTIFWLLLALKHKKLLFYACLFIISIMLIDLAYGDIGYAQGITQADNINPAFISALAWFGANSPANATVITLWPDGSVVEGVANRTSVTDSVGAQIPPKAFLFASWLFNSTPDPAFLTSNETGMPGYLLVRYSWLYETSGIFTEANINASQSNFYSYLPFNQINGKANATTSVIAFNSTYSTISAQAIIRRNSNGTQSVEAYAVNAGRISPFSYISFYNMQNGNYSIIKQSAFNHTNNQVFLIIYSSIPRSDGSLNVTAAYLLNTGMAQSNMIKLIFFCNNQQCTWDNNKATLQLVYLNSDTKIFKIIYNATK